MSLLDTFLASAQANQSKTAIIDGAGRKISFEQLSRRISAVAAGFAQKGIGKGDRVLVATPLGHDLYISLAALWWLGAVAVFPEPAMGLAGLRHAARVTRPMAFLSAGPYRWLRFLLPELWLVQVNVAPRDGVPDSVPQVALTGEDLAMISFTSGTSGAPKAIERSHAFMLAQHECVAPLLETRGKDEIDLVAFPVFVLVNLALGTTSVLPDWKMTRPDLVRASDIAKLIARFDITRALLPPVICETLSKSNAFPDLKAIFTGGGPVFPDVIARILQKRPSLAFTAVYGSTEAEPIAHLEADEINPEDWEDMESGKGLLAGTPIPQVKVRLDQDEILVAGDHVNKSYVDVRQNAGAKIEYEGEIWHRTGDAGRLDEKGRLWLLGRLDARAGKIDPFAVETAARFWPGMVRAALVARAGGPLLAVEGDSGQLAVWRNLAKSIGQLDIQHVDRIPMDKRHRSKVDYKALSRILKP